MVIIFDKNIIKYDNNVKRNRLSGKIFLDAVLMCMLKRSGTAQKAVQHDVGLLALRLWLLGFFFKLTIAPVDMWKSGAGWANRWAGGSFARPRVCPRP